jgi:hypothetical protein
MTVSVLLISKHFLAAMVDPLYEPVIAYADIGFNFRLALRDEVVDLQLILPRTWLAPNRQPCDAIR